MPHRIDGLWFALAAAALLVLFASPAARAEAAPAGVHLFILSGQSNMAGLAVR